MAHIQGPWRVVPNPMQNDGYFVVHNRRDNEPEQYTDQLAPAVVEHQLSLEDACLIAAAPDLLEAARFTLVHLTDYWTQERHDESITRLQNAIAKAEGKTDQ